MAVGEAHLPLVGFQVIQMGVGDLPAVRRAGEVAEQSVYGVPVRRAAYPHLAACCRVEVVQVRQDAFRASHPVVIPETSRCATGQVGAAGARKEVSEASRVAHPRQFYPPAAY